MAGSGDEEEVVEYRGSIVRAPVRDGYYVCPLCGEALLATPKDLMRHLVAHARGLLDLRRPVPSRRH